MSNQPRRPRNAVPFPFRSAFGELTKLVNATGVGPDIESMFDTTEEAVLREHWLASAISLGAGKWAVVNTKEDSVQVEGGRVSIRIFEDGSLQGRGRLCDRGFDGVACGGSVAAHPEPANATTTLNAERIDVRVSGRLTESLLVGRRRSGHRVSRRPGQGLS